MPETTVRKNIAGKEVTLSTGKLALLADGAVVCSIGETEVLVTATASKGLRPGADFFPLTVDCEERMYAAGKIPGSFFRREGRPTERATLTCRLIDRPLRPSFGEGFRSETHVVATVLSVDNENPYDVVALNGASAALTLSPIPFEGPIGAVRLALRDGEWIANPTFGEVDESVFELIVAGTRNSGGGTDISMVEAGATEEGYRHVQAGQPPSDEAQISRGLEEARAHISELIDMQLELAERFGEPAAVDYPVVEEFSSEMYDRVVESARSKIADSLGILDRKERKAAEEAALEETWANLGLGEDDEEARAEAAKAFKALAKEMMRRRVIEEGTRLDGRKPDELRPLSAEVSVVSRAHGTGLFQRGDTQVLSVATLGMLRMEQMLDTISLEESKRYMHHYNFPPFSTGETGFMRGPKRREIGHGYLAEKAVLPVVPKAEEFPYAVRVVSDVLTSNGSTSMASVCGSSLALMDAGVPVAEPVAGVAMGLIAHDDGFVTLTDILGAEDALGDMDFKVAGTPEMITALQLDTKIRALPAEVLAAALEQARQARLEILETMNGALAGARSEINRFAPRIEAVEIPKDKIGEIIGPKGKTIRELEELTGASFDVQEDGTVLIGSADGESLEMAKEKVLEIAFPPEVEVGDSYEGEVVNITKFGAFVNLLPGRDGLLHISKMGGGRRLDRVEDEYDLGDKVTVVVREIDDRGKVSLDLPGAEGDGGGESRPDRGRDRDRDRRGGDGGRGRGRGGGRDRKPRPRRDDDERSGPGEKAGRTVVSFSDEFEKGLDD